MLFWFGNIDLTVNIWIWLDVNKSEFYAIFGHISDYFQTFKGPLCIEKKGLGLKNFFRVANVIQSNF